MKMVKEDLIELVNLQNHVNDVINAKLENPPTAMDYITAFSVEVGEMINAVGVWKWWKHSATINKERILDELADCYAFFLSAAGTQDKPEELINQVCETFDALTDDIAAAKVDGLVAAKEAITLVLTNHENSEVRFSTTTIFAFCNKIAELVIDGLTWEDVVNAYKAKSDVNIKRQEENY